MSVDPIKTNGRFEGKRKFIVAMTLAVGYLGLCVFKLSGDQVAQTFPWVASLILGIYGGFNVGEWIARR